MNNNYWRSHIIAYEQLKQEVRCFKKTQNDTSLKQTFHFVKFTINTSEIFLITALPQRK